MLALFVAVVLNGWEQASVVIDSGAGYVGYDPKETGIDPGADSGMDTAPPVDSDGGGWTDDDDCDDTDPSVHPGVGEVCDLIDNDCDGTIDHATAADASTWYADADRDGYGTTNYTTVDCSAPSGYVADSTDCNDIAAAVVWYADGDGDTDLAIGAPTESSARGRVYVCMHGDDYWVDRGSSSPSARGTTVSSLGEAKITGAAASDRAGLSNQSLVVGDFDGDLLDDLAVGVPGYDGTSTNGGGVAIYAGGSVSGSLTLPGADWLVLGDGALGTGLWMGGDVDGDGTSDLLAGASTADSAGVLYLLTGGQAAGGYTLPDDQYANRTGEAASDAFGSAVGGLYDLDGDGTEDFAVSAPSNDRGASAAGKVYMLPAY